jgi:hypothetical protein
VTSGTRLRPYRVLSAELSFETTSKLSASIPLMELA